MKNARNQHRTDYAKELIKIVQTTKDREELKKKIAAYHERDIANAIVESDKTVRKRKLYQTWIQMMRWICLKN